mmetsp:Transcript_5388/g.16302  ORF Transcript_5388/g.16302 Transcript_5388/m.16302 type:complete len:338 (-) Transcript_5388:2693-3706(-)
MGLHGELRPAHKVSLQEPPRETEEDLVQGRRRDGIVRDVALHQKPLELLEDLRQVYGGAQNDSDLRAANLVDGQPVLLREGVQHVQHPVRRHVENAGVPAPKPPLQVSDGAERVELAGGHQANVVAKSLALFHAVGREHDRLVLRAVRYGIPQGTAGGRVQARGGLVQEHQRGVSKEGDRNTDFPLVASAQAAGLLVQEPRDPEGLDQFGHRGPDVLPVHTFDCAVELELLGDRQPRQQRVGLRAVSDQLGPAGLVRPEQVDPFTALHDQYLAMHGRRRPCQNLEERRFSRAVHTEKPKAPPLPQAERQAFQYHLLAVTHPKVLDHDKVLLAQPVGK